MPKLIEKNQSKTKHYEEVDKFLKGYFSEKHTHKDFKLMSGVVTTKAITNEALYNLEGKTNSRSSKNRNQSDEMVDIHDDIHQINDSSNQKLGPVSNFYEKEGGNWESTATRDVPIKSQKRL